MQAGQQMKIRIPVEMKDWLEREAARNMRSLTAEIVVSIRDRMERAKAVAGDSLPADPATVPNSAALPGGAITHG